MSSWKMYWEKIVLGIAVIAVILLFAKMNDQEVRSAEVQYSGEEWEQLDDGRWRKNCFQLGAAKGIYHLILVYHTGEDLVWQLQDMSSNDGENHLGRLIAQGELPAETDTLDQKIEIPEDAEKLTLYVNAPDPSALLESWMLQSESGNYADFEMLFLLGIAAFLFLFCTWKKRWDLFLVFAIAMVLMLPSMNGYLQRGDDLAFHLDRIRGLAEGLASGQFPVRLNPAFHKGYGYSVSMMYPELFLYLPAVCCLDGVSLIISYKVLLFFIHVLTAFTGLYSFKRLTGSETGGLISAIIYLLSPYRLNNIYQRAALGEAIAMAFFPLLVYGIYELFYGNSRKWWLVPLAATGVLQSHIISTELCVIFCVAAAIPFLCTVWRKENRIRLLETGKAVVTALGLNIWFLIPFLTRMQEGGIFQKGTYDLQSYAVELWNLFRYEVRLEGRYDIEGITHWDFISLGIASLIGIGVFLYYAYGKKRIVPKYERIGTVCLILGGISCYMATRIFPWNFMQVHFAKVYDLIGRMQFPWRMCGYAAVFFAVIAGIAAEELSRDKKEIVIAAMLFTACMTALSCMDQYADKNVYISSRSVVTASPNADYYSLDTIENVILDQGDTVVADPEVSIYEYERDGMNLSFSYDGAFENCRMRLPLYDYGMHKVYINGTEVETDPPENHQMVLLLDGTQQSGKLEIRYEEPWLYKAGDFISLIFVVGWAGIWLWNRRKKGEKTGNAVNHCAVL